MLLSFSEICLSPLSWSQFSTSCSLHRSGKFAPRRAVAGRSQGECFRRRRIELAEMSKTSRAHEYPNIWPRLLFAADGELRKNAAIVICPRDSGPRGWRALFNCSRVGRSAFFFGIVGIAQAAHIGRLRPQYVIIVKPKTTEKSAFSATENKACERHLITVAIHSRRQ